MPSALSQRSNPVLDKRAGPSCGLSCFGQPRYYEKTMEGLLGESLSSPAPHVGTAFSRRTPQQHPAGGPDVYRGPWSGGGGLGEIKQTTKASRVGEKPSSKFLISPHLQPSRSHRLRSPFSPYLIKHQQVGRKRSLDSPGKRVRERVAGKVGGRRIRTKSPRLSQMEGLESKHSSVASFYRRGKEAQRSGFLCYV